MKPQLFSHPFSSYCQKVLIALYENDVDFEYRMLEDEGVRLPGQRREALARNASASGIGVSPALLVQLRALAA